MSSPFDPTVPPPADPRPSVGEAFAGVASDLSLLMRQEVALAKAELRQSAARAARGAGLMAGAGVGAPHGRAVRV